MELAPYRKGPSGAIRDDWTPFAIFTTSWVHRNLIFRLVKRQVEARHRGHFLGLAWSLLNPLMMLAVYTFVFREVFQARWNAPSEGKVEFALVLFCGLILFNIFGDCVSRSPGLMIENANYIKKVVFPLEILPWVVVLVGIFDALTALIPFAVFYGFILGPPPVTALLFPIVVVPLVLISLGLSWFFSSLGVFLRDINQFVRVVVTALLFGSAIFFPPELIPESFRTFSYVNPIVWIVETARGMLFWGKLPHYATLIEYTLVSWLVAWMGYVWFMKTRKGFADVV